MFMLLSRYWWVLVVRGAIAILFGVLAYTLPLATLATLVLVFGAYAFVEGSFAVVSAVAGRDLTPDWWILLLQGLLGIGVGMLTLFNPEVTAVALLVYIAAWAVVAGLLQVYAAIKLRQELTGEWWLALGGIAGVAFGILMMWRPAVGALAVLWLIATYAILWGVMLMFSGLVVYRARKQALTARAA
jgi:uncharacterized membrane protein HdeD (DUF308 family)